MVKQNQNDDDMFSKESEGGGRRTSVCSFSIESDDDSNDADSSSYSGSEAAIVSHPSTIKAYELELKRAFAYWHVEQHRRVPPSSPKGIKKSVTVKGEDRNISRRTSADWHEMIQKKEEEKQQRLDAKLAARTGVAASLCDDSVEIEEIDMDDSDASLEIEVESQVESEVKIEEERMSDKDGENEVESEAEDDEMSDGDNDIEKATPVSDINTQENEGKALQQQQRDPTKSQKRRIMALSILLVFGLVLILGLVIGLTGQGHNNATSQNLRGENGATSSTSKPAPVAIPSKQPTGHFNDTTSILTPMEETAVGGAASMSTTTGAGSVTSQTSDQPAQSNSTATTTNMAEAVSATSPTTADKPTQDDSTTTMAGSVSGGNSPSATTFNQSAQSNSATDMVEAVSGTSPSTTSNQPAQATASTLICDSVKSVGDQCNSALQLLEKCTSSGTTSHGRYGTSTAIHVNGEDVLAIVGGANSDNQATLLSYDKSARSWDHVANLDATDSSSSIISPEQYGSAVAMSSEWIAISTHDLASTSITLYRVSNAMQNIYNANPGLSIEQADETLETHFGSSLAIDNDVLVVGAMRDRDNRGSVYIYHYDDGWRQVSKLQSDNISPHEQGNFGRSVAISNNIIVVGAPNDTVDGKEQCGSVYIFQVQDSPGRIAYIQKLSPVELSAGDGFGNVVTVDVTINPTTNMREDRIVVGTNMDDDKGTNSGSVSIYLRRVGERVFSLEQKLLPSDFSPKSTFGSSIDMQGYQMVVGSKGYGVASLFEYNGESWVEAGSTNDVDSGRALGDDFGSSVGIASWEASTDSAGAGGVVLVGAPLNDEAGEDSGRIYSYAICNDVGLDEDQAGTIFK